MEFIQSWMVSLLITIGGLVAMMAVGRYKTEQNQKEIEAEKTARESAILAMGKKLDKSVEELAEYKVRLHNAPSMEDVRKEFVSKEMFRQMEKHIDGQFDSLGKFLEKLSGNQDKILDKLKDK